MKGAGMTNEEAREIILNTAFIGRSMEDIDTAIEMAAKALEQEPQTFKWCTDCREYDQEKHCCHRWSKVIRDTVEETKQEPKTGQWIVHPIYAHLVCSKCLSGAPYDCKTNYCPNCGADMREVEE
jgi:hypothetical protein